MANHYLMIKFNLYSNNEPTSDIGTLPEHVTKLTKSKQATCLKLSDWEQKMAYL